MRAAPRIALLLLPAAGLVWPGCAGAGPQPAAATGPAERWADLMVERVGPGYDELVAEARLPGPEIDLAKVSAQARALAALVALGHAELRDPTVDRFAQHARATEEWLLAIADAADSGDRTAVRRLVPQEAEHCDACHAAAERSGRK